MNTVAHLQSSALAGQVVVSDEIYARATGQCVQAEAVSLALRGKSEPVLGRALTRGDDWSWPVSSLAPSNAFIHRRPVMPLPAGRGSRAHAKCQTKFDLKLAKLNDQASAAATACRYGVNGDGTVTDYDTGLQWEQKTDDGTSVHDKDNVYTWTLSIVPPDGTAFTAFLGTLNNGTSYRYDAGSPTSGCFAGHCDWRLPAIAELMGIADLTQGNCGGSTGPCIDQVVFGPTVADLYWSASTRLVDSTSAWAGNFQTSFTLTYDYKSSPRYVRAVRSAL